MNDLVEFLQARLDEFAVHARLSIDVDQQMSRQMRHDPDRSPWNSQGKLQLTPRMMLAEVEMQLRIVEIHVSGTARCGWCAASVGDCPTLRLLTLPYADHPDYDPAWGPVR